MPMKPDTPRRRRVGRTESRGLQTRAWRKLARLYLQEHPECADPYGVHRADGQVVEAREVDHIVPRRHAPGRVLDWSNLQGLCRRCHRRKTMGGL